RAATGTWRYESETVAYAVCFGLVSRGLAGSDQCGAGRIQRGAADAGRIAARDRLGIFIRLPRRETGSVHAAIAGTRRRLQQDLPDLEPGRTGERQIRLERGRRVRRSAQNAGGRLDRALFKFTMGGGPARRPAAAVAREKSGRLLSLRERTRPALPGPGSLLAERLRAEQPDLLVGNEGGIRR